MGCRSFGGAVVAALVLAGTLPVPLAAQERPVADLSEIERFAEEWLGDQFYDNPRGIAEARALTGAIWDTYPNLFRYEQARHEQCLREAKDLVAARDVSSVQELPEGERDRVLRIIEIDGLLTDRTQESPPPDETAFIALVTMLSADVLEVENPGAERALQQYREARAPLFQAYSDGMGADAEALATTPCGAPGTPALVARYQSDREAFRTLVARRLSVAVGIMTAR